ncbi:MAG: energy transducer TonB [Rhodocyclaceae bacterium]|nr:energy transducer TonB [Rhodocyclaceae bacterium]MDP1957639.1 energy transducer TonB [Rhodocyclaceae bacterium]
MTAMRCGLSILASLLLHAVVLWPFGFFAQRAAPVPRSVLEAVLLAPVLATPETTSAPEPAAVPVNQASRPDAAQLPMRPAPTITPKPRELQGRALNTALAALAKQEFYPHEAIERGIEGDVIVLLTLTSNGGVAAAAVATGSGHPILDAAALAAVRGISGLPVAQRQVLLPVRFRLD